VLASHLRMYSAPAVCILVKNRLRSTMNCSHGSGFLWPFFTSPWYCLCQAVFILLLDGGLGHTQFAVIIYKDWVPSTQNSCDAHQPKSSLLDCLCRLSILPSRNWQTLLGSFRFLAVCSSWQLLVTSLTFPGVFRVTCTICRSGFVVFYANRTFF
jgi:hypothetical protein